MKEDWVPIRGYEGLYDISNKGRVRSLDRTVKCQGGDYHVTGRILKLHKKPSGYMFVTLAKNGRAKRYYLHRLIAEAFIPNPLRLKQINHKDENKTNNALSNLEWCTASYNINYGKRSAKVIETKNKNASIGAERPVLKFDKSGKFIKEYQSIKIAAERNGVYRSNIYKCCSGKYSQTGGYKWKFKDQLQYENR